MNEDTKLKEEMVEDDFSGLDDGLAGSSEDAYDGDYTISQVKVGNKTQNKRIGTFTPKTEKLPSLDEKIQEAESLRKSQPENNIKKNRDLEK